MNSMLSLSNLSRTNLSLFDIQTQLSTGRRVNRPSDDAVAAASISVLDERLERTQQVLRNLDTATSSLNVLDAAIGGVNDMILEAKSIAHEQLSFSTSKEEREDQSIVIQSIIDQLFTAANGESLVGYMFGGSITSRPPIQEHLGGYRFTGDAPGLITDLGLSAIAPVTLSPNNAIGAVSARKHGTTDLDPALTANTRLVDLRGAAGMGVRTGPIEFAVGDGERVRIDLSKSDTIGDVVDRVEFALRAYEEANDVTLLGDDGVGFSDSAITLDLMPDIDGEPIELRFFNVSGGSAATDLGIAAGAGMVFSDASDSGVDLDPMLTWQSEVADFDGRPLGVVTLSNAGLTRQIDLSGARTVEDIRNLIEGSGLGVRVEINDDATGINILSDLATGFENGMVIVDGDDGAETAARLGIRTFSSETRLEHFNDSRGVRIVDNRADPVSGLVTADANVDFDVILGDGRTISVDLRPQDIQTVGSLIARINEAAADAGVDVPGEFVAELHPTQGGLVFRQDPSQTERIKVEARNGSFAAEDLGLLTSAYDADTGAMLGDDRARVRVDNLFTQLIDLRDALLSDDTLGITFAGERLEASITRVAQSRALVGGYAKRIESEVVRVQDMAVIDEQIRSTLRDTDFAAASVQFALLQNQLEASLRVMGSAQQVSLLDFLG